MPSPRASTLTSNDLWKQTHTDEPGGSIATRTIDAFDILTARFAYDVNGNVEYAGYAAPGAATDAAVWMIKKFIYDTGNVTEILFADGDAYADNVWDDYASLSYS